MYIKILQFIYLIKLTCTTEINITISKTQFNNKSEHLNYKYIQKLCSNIDTVCKNNHTNLCAVRKVNETYEHRDFENSCFLLLNNMCLDFENEFAIAQIGSCRDYLLSRRSTDYITDNSTDGFEAVDDNGDPTFATETDAFTTDVTEPNDNEITTDVTEPDGNENETGVTELDENTPDVTETDGNDEITNTTKPALRKFSFSTLYEMEQAFDGHICPHSCHKVYQPVCLSANRGNGKYFKMWLFVNHCFGDQYYCKNWQEFAPPPDEYEDVRDSPITWSYCGSNKFVSFSRVSEDISSMNRYGWLNGDYRYNHILEPWERKPGYGR